MNSLFLLLDKDVRRPISCLPTRSEQYSEGGIGGVSVDSKQLRNHDDHGDSPDDEDH